MKLYINNTFVASVTDGEIRGNQVGVLVAGTGSFYLDNLTVYDMNEDHWMSAPPERPEEITDEASEEQTSETAGAELAGADTPYQTHAPAEAVELSVQTSYTSPSETTVAIETITITQEKTTYTPYVDALIQQTKATWQTLPVFYTKMVSRPKITCLPFYPYGTLVRRFTRKTPTALRIRLRVGSFLTKTR